MARINLAFWSLLWNSHIKSLQLCEVKSFFHLFFRLGNVFINQSSSGCVWWKVKTKLICLFFFFPRYFSNRLCLIIFWILFCFNLVFDFSEINRYSYTYRLWNWLWLYSITYIASCHLLIAMKFLGLCNNDKVIFVYFSYLKFLLSVMKILVN